MSEVEILPELKEIIGAVLFAAKSPVTLEQLHGLMSGAAERMGGITKHFAAATLEDVQAAVDALRADLEKAKTGLRISEVAHGFRLENSPVCGLWLRAFLEKGKPNRLTQPALETLAIIAYRQPVMRSEIEAVRGVAVDQLIRNLLDLQLIRIAGRSDLPGRPWLFGTTQKFLEHFGLRSIEDLPGGEELKRFQRPPSEAVDQRQMELPIGSKAPPVGFHEAAWAATAAQDEVDAIHPAAEDEESASPEKTRAEEEPVEEEGNLAPEGGESPDEIEGDEEEEYDDEDDDDDEDEDGDAADEDDEGEDGDEDEDDPEGDPKS